MPDRTEIYKAGFTVAQFHKIKLVHPDAHLWRAFKRLIAFIETTNYGSLCAKLLKRCN